MIEHGPGIISAIRYPNLRNECTILHSDWNYFGIVRFKKRIINGK